MEEAIIMYIYIYSVLLRLVSDGPKLSSVRKAAVRGKGKPRQDILVWYGKITQSPVKFGVMLSLPSASV